MAALATVLFIAWTACYAISVYQSHKVERLLQQLAALEPGKTDARTVQEISRLFGGKSHRTNTNCGYDFETSFGFGNVSRRVFGRTEWDALGLRPWRFHAYLETQSNTLEYAGFSILVGRGRGWLYRQSPLSRNLWGWLSASVTLTGKESTGDRASHLGDRQVAPGFAIRKPSFDIEGCGEAIESFLTPNVSPGIERLRSPSTFGA